MTKKAKLFEVYRNGVCLMSTEYEEAIPKHETLLQMQKLGYTFKREGKAWKPNRRKKSDGETDE